MYPRYVPTRQSYDIKPAPKTWFAKFFAQILRIIYHVVGTFCMSWVRDRYRGCILNDIVGTMYICRGEHKITMSCVHVVGNTELPCLGYMSWVHLNDIVGNTKLPCLVYMSWGTPNYHILGTYRGYISWVSKFISWVHVLGVCRVYISWVRVLGTRRGYMSCVHIVCTCLVHMSWVLVTTSWVHIVDTPLGYPRYDYILGPQVSSGRVLCTTT